MQSYDIRYTIISGQALKPATKIRNTIMTLPKITIETNADFTPKGKRVAKVVRHAMSGKKISPIIRMYVAGRAYMDKDLQEFELVNEWLGA